MGWELWIGLSERGSGICIKQLIFWGVGGGG